MTTLVTSEKSAGPNVSSASASDANLPVPLSWNPLPAIFRVLAAQNCRSVLLETAKQDASDDKSLLFLEPIEELVAWAEEDLDRVLSQVDRHTAEGRFVAGFLTYECGEHFIGLPPNKLGDEGLRKPLAWLGVFTDRIEFDHRTGAIRGPLPVIHAYDETRDNPAAIAVEGLQISRQDYAEKLTRIHEYLSAGDTYQVNFTDRICGTTDASPLAVYETLLCEQPVPFAAFMNSPYGAILSFSPELFYRVRHKEITVRPMKGTWSRGVNTAGDREAADRLQNDEKNRSEHVMIVDLLRNDLGRLCEYGTVQIAGLFKIERYATLLQMTSSVSGRLRGALSPSEVFRTLFPSGSITGAPKQRTMEIIRELECSPRGVYTGAIGYFALDESCFNVAIRTLSLEDKKITLGVGGGITAGSVAQEEYAECCLKAAFLTRRRPSFSLIETMRCEGGIALLPLHLKRLSDSADYFDIRYDAAALTNEITKAAMSCGDQVSRIRLELSKRGVWSISSAPLENLPWTGQIVLASERIDSRDVFLHHKTTNRHFYERHLAEARNAGFDEVLFLNESSQLTEGAISNYFFRMKERWFTPKLECGLLPGIQRSAMLQSLTGCEECELTLNDLAEVDAIFCCNALRGIRDVRSLQSLDGAIIWSANPMP
jgi:para-aminobenzoate synthetase/4-amino-4-deoxychorismate lyase